jgi:putative membrane-bound dehydrogenase-like protein
MRFMQHLTRSWKFTLVLGAGMVLLAAPGVFAGGSTRPMQQIKLNGHTFTLPAGFDIELVAGPPLVDRPITADFDEQGQLYVADSSGSNEKVDIQLKKKPHRILRLEDTRGTGRFDKRTVFADGMMFPEGTMWHAGSLYVAAPPSIWKLTDTNGDGVADQRIEWFKGKTLTGCANDLHGPYLGPDGWIYWCKGAFARQTHELAVNPEKGKGTRVFSTRAAHVFRCRPDGTLLEPVMTGGMDNPVDLVFTPGGERIITTTFFQYPGGGKRDGLIHIVYGGIYGKEHDSIYEHPWTGPSVMPVLTHLGPAAPSGLHRYESTAFGPEYRDNLFAALFNLQKITRHVLEPSGATFKCHDEDFLVSDNKDFHPTDVIEDADGSLLVVDTGGWYKLCCPSSQLSKPDVLGAIYRVRKKDASRVADPRGLKLAWNKLTAAQLADLLDDPRPAVRRRAIGALAANPPGSFRALAGVLKHDASVEKRRNAIWAATRSDALRAVVYEASFADLDETVVQAAIHSVGVWRDRQSSPHLRQLLYRNSLHNRRAAAEALGRLGDKAVIGDLLAAAQKTTDRVLEHSITYALIEIGDRAETAKGLRSPNPSTRRAALIALDQMEKSTLASEPVLAELTSADRRLKEAAWWIASRHAEWGEKLSGILRARLGSGKLTSAEREDLQQQLVRLARSSAVQTLLGECASDSAASPDAKTLALRVMAQAGLKEAPQAWLTALTKLLEGSDVAMTREGVATLRALRWPKQRPQALVATLRKIGEDDKAPADVRLLALAALPDGLTKVAPPLAGFLRLHVVADQPVAVRGLAADVLARARLDREPLLELASAVPSIGPMEIDRVLDAFTASTDEVVGAKLLAALKESPARKSLRPDSLRTRLAKHSPAIRKQADELVASLHEDTAKQLARLDEMISSLPAGEVRRGQVVFNNSKAACISCHAIGYVGGKIGPDLTRIGGIRTERDLLESIVFPNASFVRGYESVYVATQNGKTYNGILKKDAPDEIVLTLGADQEVRIARRDIDDIRPGLVSIMPSGLDQQLSRQDLADLVAFLKACK